jgi:hypothetical protein
MSGKQRQLAMLAVLSVMLCGMAGEMGETFATIMFACLTFGIILLCPVTITTGGARHEKARLAAVPSTSKRVTIDVSHPAAQS